MIYCDMTDIRNAGLGSVPKIANCSLFALFIHSDPSGKIICSKGSFCRKPTGWYVLHY